MTTALLCLVVGFVLGTVAVLVLGALAASSSESERERQRERERAQAHYIGILERQLLDSCREETDE